jgi:hypothetical protein
MTETVVSSAPMHDLARDVAPSQAVVEAVAEAEGVDPMGLHTTLYEVIDPDALDALFQSSSADVAGPRIEFTYHGYVVTVTGDGVAVTGE